MKWSRARPRSPPAAAAVCRDPDEDWAAGLDTAAGGVEATKDPGAEVGGAGRGQGAKAGGVVLAVVRHGWGLRCGGLTLLVFQVLARVPPYAHAC